MPALSNAIPPSDERPRSVARASVAWLVAPLLLFFSLATTTLLRSDAINHDAALYLQCGQLLLDGAVPYRDFVDINPPMVMYVNVVPAGLARLAYLPSVAAFHVFVLVLLLISILQMSALLQRVKGLRPGDVSLLLLAFVGVSALARLENDFGQREHLFVIAYLPWVTLRLLRHQGAEPPARWLKVWIGLQAGFALSFKPHFIAIALLVEAVQLLMTRRFRTLFSSEIIAAAAIGIVYAAHWLVVPQEMRDAFFHRWVPMVTDGYAAYGIGIGPTAKTLISRPQNLLCLIISLLTIGAAFRARDRAWRLLWATAAAIAVGGLAMYVLQAKGWSYHMLPVYAAVAPAAAGVFLLRRGLAAQSFQPTHFVTGLLAALAISLALFRLPPGFRTGAAAAPPDLVAAVAAHSQPGDRILVLSTSVTPAYPLLVTMDRQPGSRYLWTFPAAFFSYACDFPKGYVHQPSPAEQQFQSDLLQDLRRLQPRMIVITDSNMNQGCPPGFNLYEAMKAGGFVSAAIEAGYAERSNAAAGFRIYVRSRPAATPSPPSGDRP